jgi:hypothetical protein
MPTNPLYDTVIKKLQQLRPGERITRLRNLAWLMRGIFASKSVQLPKIALKIPSQAVQLSIVKRLHRFLDNPSFQVRSWYEPIARQILEQLAKSVGEVRLLMDATTIGSQHQWLTVSLAFRRRAIPIVWTWRAGVKGHSSATVQLALLAYVYRLVPQNIPVVLVPTPNLRTAACKNSSMTGIGRMSSARNPTTWCKSRVNGVPSVRCFQNPGLPLGWKTPYSLGDINSPPICWPTGNRAKSSLGYWPPTCRPNGSPSKPTSAACGLKRCMGT